MYNPAAQNQESKELKENRRLVNEMGRSMAADDLGHENHVPVLEVSPDIYKNSDSGERPTIDFGSLGRTENGEIGEKVSRIVEVPAGRKQGEDLAPERAPITGAYSDEKQKRRWSLFGRRPKKTTTNNPAPQSQSGSYFRSNEGRRMVVDTPNYDRSTYFRHNEANPRETSSIKENDIPSSASSEEPPIPDASPVSPEPVQQPAPAHEEYEETEADDLDDIMNYDLRIPYEDEENGPEIAFRKESVEPIPSADEGINKEPSEPETIASESAAPETLREPTNASATPLVSRMRANIHRNISASEDDQYNQYTAQWRPRKKPDIDSPQTV